MAGLNDDENSDGAAVTSPPRLVNVHKQLVEGDEQDLTSTLTKTLNQDEDEATSTDASTTLPASPMSTANILDNHSNHSNPCADSNADIDDNSKTMEVTISVLSLHGIVAKKSRSSNKLDKKLKRKGGALPLDPTATIVASFAQNISKERVFLTHVPSFPVPLTSGATSSSAAAASDSSSSSGNGGGGGMLQPVVHWPSMDAEDAEAGNALSTLQFKRQFVREEGGRARFVPQTCPINLSISRNGKLALLGKVNLIINGEERGESSVTVPITSSIRASKTNGNPLKQAKKISSLAAAAAKGKQVKQQNTPMIKIKGDTFQFGLEGGAMLRVLVHVNDPDAAPILEEKETANNEGDTDNEDDSYSDNAEDDDSRQCLSLEGEDSSLLDQDDYMNVNNFMMENNELRTLRQQLAKSEQTNNILQMELANAQHSSQMQYQEEYERQEENDRLRVELKQSTQNAETLLNELNASKSESEALPFYETRVSELLEELQRRDLELECLREEIGELRGDYKEQLVDSLLWDDDDENDSPTTEGEGMLEKWGVRKLGISLSPVTEDEKMTESEGVLDKWRVRKLGASLKVGLEEKIMIRDDDGDDDNDDNPREDETPEVSPEIDDNLDEETPDGATSSAEAKGVASKEGNDGTEESQDTPPEVEASAEDVSSKKQQGGSGWGVRRLGASLKGMEGRMKERQRQFQKQQQIADQQKAKELKAAAAAAQPGLGDVLVSRFSTHGSKQEVTVPTALESVEESAEESDEEAETKGMAEPEEPSSSSHSNDTTSDIEQAATREDSLPSTVISSEEVTKEEVSRRLSSSDHAPLLESVEKIGDELLSGNTSNEDAPMSDGNTSKADKDGPIRDGNISMGDESHSDMVSRILSGGMNKSNHGGRQEILLLESVGGESHDNKTTATSTDLRNSSDNDKITTAEDSVPPRHSTDCFLNEISKEEAPSENVKKSKEDPDDGISKEVASRVGLVSRILKGGMNKSNSNEALLPLPKERVQEEEEPSSSLSKVTNDDIEGTSIPSESPPLSANTSDGSEPAPQRECVNVEMEQPPPLDTIKDNETSTIADSSPISTASPANANDIIVEEEPSHISVKREHLSSENDQNESVEEEMCIGEITVGLLPTTDTSSPSSGSRETEDRPPSKNDQNESVEEIVEEITDKPLPTTNTNSSSDVKETESEPPLSTPTKDTGNGDNEITRIDSSPASNTDSSPSPDDEISYSDESDGFREFLRCISSDTIDSIPQKERIHQGNNKVESPAQNEKSDEEDMEIPATAAVI
mmetsp:Transcript_14126/g.24826  ORF Transcript_14126/g.24826 Transcript_14126/m.24826 type:complete len:1280 (-) Transcript_14126:215-4054(-)